MNETKIKETGEGRWKRLSIKGNKVWASIDKDGKLLAKNGRVRIKYNLKQNYEYQAKKENLKPESEAVPKQKKDKQKTKGNNKYKAISFKPQNRSSQSASKPASSYTAEIRDMPENAIIIYTDGASSGNPGPGGIGILFIFGEHRKEISQFIGNATNNIAELKAIKTALSEIKRHDLPVRLFTDSGYSIGLLTKGWKSRKNIELVENIKKIMRKFKDLKFIKVKGHNGVEGNETADRLATSALKNKKTG